MANEQVIDQRIEVVDTQGHHSLYFHVRDWGYDKDPEGKLWLRLSDGGRAEYALSHVRKVRT